MFLIYFCLHEYNQAVWLVAVEFEISVASYRIEAVVFFELIVVCYKYASRMLVHHIHYSFHMIHYYTSFHLHHHHYYNHHRMKSSRVEYRLL